MDGTPRDCASPACGSEGDTSIIRDREISGGNKASALGRTNKGGKVDAAKDIEMFMNGPGGAATTKPAKRGLLDGLMGGGGGGADAQGQKTPKGTSETGVKAAAGKGATSGMPTCSDNGEITLTYHQVNQDGAGPLKAEVDPTSGGTDPSAFKEAKVTQDVPGIGIGGLSGAAVMDFPVKVQMPEGMQCQGKAGPAENVCIVRVRNSAAAGKFLSSYPFVLLLTRYQAPSVAPPPSSSLPAPRSVPSSTTSASATWPAAPSPRSSKRSSPPSGAVIVGAAAVVKNVCMLWTGRLGGVCCAHNEQVSSYSFSLLPLLPWSWSWCSLPFLFFLALVPPNPPECSCNAPLIITH